MACEEEKTQVEILEILTELQREAVENNEVAVIVADSDAADACGGGSLSSLLLKLAKGKVTPSDLSEDCVQAIEHWVDKIQEYLESEVLWSHCSRVLGEARNRYGHCLHEQKAGISTD